jgi:hypothetical protein
MVQLRKSVPGFPLPGRKPEAGWERKSQSPRGLGHFPAHSLPGRGWEGLLQRENSGFPTSRGYSLTERVSIGNAHSSAGSVMAALVGVSQPLVEKMVFNMHAQKFAQGGASLPYVPRDLYPPPPWGVKSLRSIEFDARACQDFCACKFKHGGYP